MKLPRKNAPWLGWLRELQAIAQTGLCYSEGPYDRERYAQLRELVLHMVEAHCDLPLGQAQALFESEVGPATPRVDVRGVVLQEDRVLLVRERSDGCWSLPGGWADVGESPAQSVVREILEESGYRARATRLLALHDRDRHNSPPLVYSVYKLFFACELEDEKGPEVSHEPNTEIEAVGFFPLTELPPLSLGRNTAEQIARMVELIQTPLSPAEFD